MGESVDQVEPLRIRDKSFLTLTSRTSLSGRLSPSAFLFARKGRIQFTLEPANPHETLDEEAKRIAYDDLFDIAAEASAEDVSMKTRKEDQQDSVSGETITVEETIYEVGIEMGIILRGCRLKPKHATLIQVITDPTQVTSIASAITSTLEKKGTLDSQPVFKVTDVSVAYLPMAPLHPPGETPADETAMLIDEDTAQTLANLMDGLEDIEEMHKTWTNVEGF